MEVQLGETAVTMDKRFKAGTKLFLLRVHGDETDAQSVGRWWVEEFGGSFLDIISPTREVKFILDGQEIQVDPNRIFTPTGIKRTLISHSIEPKPAIIQEVGKLSDTILRECFEKKHVIALHNNQNFNITYYEEGGECAAGAKKVHRNTEMNPHNLVLVTKNADFESLKKKNINAVLLTSEEADYPGSFSEYCFQSNTRYFNIETQMGEEQVQRQLLAEVAKIVLHSP